MNLAIIKPDHLGDLILSSAAIRALLAAFPDSHLYVSPKNIPLARYLFPNAELREIFLPHLNKGGQAEAHPVNLGAYDQVAMLRCDNIITPRWLSNHNEYFVMPADTNDLHQSVIDYSVVRGLRAAYDLDEMQLGASAKELQRKARLRPRKIGFSIGSGFHANAWPVAKWVDLARELLEKCDEITILCGLPDLPIAKAIAAALGNPRKLGLEIGSSDFASFVSRVAELDVVIATDGGTAHLCSLGAPILSICGPSPYRRYSPFGLHNRLITRDMSCSPCCQYAAHLANSCLSNECMIGISPDAVAAVALRPARTLKAGIVSVRGGFTLVQGTSHLDREEIFDAFEV